MNRRGKYDNERTLPSINSRIASRVQSVFARTLTANVTPDVNDTVNVATSRKASQLINALSCVSEPDGKRQLQDVVDAIVNGNVSLSEIVTALFDIEGLDDVEMAAYLCNTSVLIESGMITLGDIDAAKLRDRAVYEVCNRHCGCEGNGVSRILENVATSGRSNVRDTIFNCMLCSLLSSHTSPSITTRSLVLVKPVLKCVNALFNAREKHHVVTGWARIAAFQPSSNKSVDENDTAMVSQHTNRTPRQHYSNKAQWSTELRGLAVMQKPSDFLANGKQEEEALHALFKELSTTEMLNLMNEIITTITSTNKCILGGRYPRICILARQAGSLEVDKSTESAVVIMEKALTSAICGIQLATDGRRQAILLTLARFFFSSKDTSNVRMYERWFLNVLKSAAKPSSKFLLDILQELVPLEPIAYLKCHMRCFRRVQAWMELSCDYVSLARTRVKDLDIITQPGVVQGSSGIAAAKKLAAEEVCRYIVEYHRGDGKSVPLSLVRFMNFHRYNFRNKVLPTLLKPDAEPPADTIEREFSRGGIDEFDRRRMALIKVLAHVRKDRAITVDEADECIPKIEDVIRNRRKKAGVKIVVKNIHVREISDDCALSEIFEEFCNASLNHLGPEDDGVVDEATKRWKHAQKLLVDKLSGFENVAQGAADVLQLVADRVQIGAAQNDVNVQVNGSSACEQERTQYLRLWRSVERWLEFLVTRVLCRQNLRRFWDTLKLQTVVCLCLQSKKLSVKQVTGIAVFLFAIVKFSEGVDHNALPFLQADNGNTLKHLVTTISEALPLDCGEHVLNSARFAITYLMLVIVNSQNPILAEFAVPVQGPDGNAHLIESDREPLASSKLPTELVMIVQWVLCTPWRLHSSSVTVGRTSRQNVSAHQILLVLQKALSVTQALEVFQCKRFSVTDWVLLEVRSGWGRPDEVAKIMHKYKSNTLSSTEIVAQVAHKMATITAEGASYPSWIVLGLSEFARDIESGVLEEPGTQLKSLSRMVSKCIQTDGVRPGILLVQIAKSLPPRIYFLGEPVSHVFVHIQQVLSPLLWPFSRVLVHFLLSAIIANDITPTDSRSTQIMTENPPAMFVADLAHFTSSSAVVRRFYDEKINSLSSSMWSGLHSQVVTFRKVFSRLQLHGRVSEDDVPALGTQALGTQAPSLGMSEARRAVQQHPETLALGLLRAAAHGGINSLNELGSRIEWLVGAIGGSVTADVLDVAVDVTAQLSIARAGDSTNGICMEIENWAAPALRELIRCRITLCTSAQIPYWLRGGSNPCDSVHLPFFVHRIRQMLGLVVECDGVEDESTPATINGLPDGRAPKRIRRPAAECVSMLHITWHVRIAAALNDLTDDVLEEAIQLCSSSSLDVGVLPMLTNAIQSLRTADLKILRGKFLKMKLAPRSENAMGKLLGSLDTAICAVIERYVKLWPVHADNWNRLRKFLPHLQAPKSTTRPVENGRDFNDWYEVES